MNEPDTPKMRNGLILFVEKEAATRYKWVNHNSFPYPESGLFYYLLRDECRSCSDYPSKQSDMGPHWLLKRVLSLSLSLYLFVCQPLCFFFFFSLSVCCLNVCLSVCLSVSVRLSSTSISSSPPSSSSSLSLSLSYTMKT